MMHFAGALALCVLVSLAVCMGAWSLSWLFERGDREYKDVQTSAPSRSGSIEVVRGGGVTILVMKLRTYHESTIADLLSAAGIVPGDSDSIRIRWHGVGISGFHCIEDVGEMPPAPIPGCEMVLCCGAHTVRIAIRPDMGP